jgi:hypothetical protein
VFKNSVEGGNSGLSDSVGFWKIRKKSLKFGKIRPKRSGEDGGTVEMWNIEIRLVLAIHRLTSPINRRFSPKFVVAISGRILPKTGRILSKIGKWKEKTVENNVMTSTEFVHANSP